MTPEGRRLAQQAFVMIQPFADELGLLFYSRLFELDGGLRGLFKHDLANQAHSLMTMLQLAIERLDAPEEADYEKKVTLQIDGQTVTVPLAEPLKDANGNVVQALDGTSTPRYIISTASRKKRSDYPPEVTQAVEQLLRLPRLRMLAAVIKIVMRDRIYDNELQMICKLYHAARIWKRMERWMTSSPTKWDT